MINWKCLKIDFDQFKGGFEEDYFDEDCVVELPKNKFKILQKYRIKIDFSQFN